jgi:hypothetical protein
MVWGLFPGVYKNVSWESHMLGFFSGAILAVCYRKQGPQRPVYEWMKDEEENKENAEGDSIVLEDDTNRGMGEEETLA